MSYTVSKVYSDAYKNKFEWNRWLPTSVHRFHDLMFRELCCPVELQMGVILPFVSSCCGPSVRGLFSTRPSVLNLYWINVGSSGSGKTQARERMVSEPMKYMLDNMDETFENFEISDFTRAGIKDKLITTDGYCFILSDEGNDFFNDIKKKEKNNESDIGLLNQLYDGKGDKTTLAQNRERIVPQNSTSISVSVQPVPFINAISSMGESMWLSSGFGERFLVSAAQPFKFMSKEKRQARDELLQSYREDLLGNIMLNIYKHHKDSGITYKLNKQAVERYEDIVDRYAGQFNLKYSLDHFGSQPQLDSLEREEIAVRTKAAELIGRLAIVLSIYTEAFLCTLQGLPFSLSTDVKECFVAFAEEIVNMSYIHSETFSSSVFSNISPLQSSLSKPKISDRSRVVSAIIKTDGPVAVVRSMARNLRNMTTEVVKEELKKLHEEGYGQFVSKDQMHRDRLLPFNQCLNVFLKPDISNVDDKFIEMASDKDITRGTYRVFFSKKMKEENYKKIVGRYHSDRRLIFISQEVNPKDYIDSDSDVDNSKNQFVPLNPNATNMRVFGQTSKVSKHTERVIDVDKKKSNVQMGMKDRNAGNVETASDLFSSGNDEDGTFAGHTSSSSESMPSAQIQKHFAKSDSKYKKQPKIVLSKLKGTVQYTQVKGGRKFIPKTGQDIISDTTVSTDDDSSTKNTKEDVRKKGTQQSQVKSLKIWQSTDDSEDNGVRSIPETCTVSSGKAKGKTSRWNRPPPPKPKKLVGPLRKSKRIEALKEKSDNDKSKDSHSSDSKKKESDRNCKKRRLSRSRRDEIHSKKIKLNP